MAKLSIDELNTFEDESIEQSFDYKQFIDDYFEPMEISDEQKENRKEAALDLFNLFLFFFTYMKMFPEKYQMALAQLEFELRYTAIEYSRPSGYIDKYVSTVSQNVAETTQKHLDEDYYTSVERATYVGAVEANTILNYEELLEAVEDGMNVKTWHTMGDRKVRDTHRPLDKMRIGIAEFFPVGDSMLLFPRDEDNCVNAGDIANCRCSLTFDFDPNYPVFSIDEYEDYIASEEGLRTGDGETSVDWHVVKSKEYTRRFDELSDNPKANSLAAQYARKALRNRDGLDTEEIYAIDMNRGVLVSKITDQQYRLAVKRTDKFNDDVNRIMEMGNQVLFIHNHPYNGIPSLTDLNELLEHANAVGITLGHKGSIYYYTKPNGEISDFVLTIAKKHNKFYNDNTLIDEKAMEDIATQFEFEFKIL